MPKSAWETVASPVPFTARRAAAPIDGDVVSHFKLTRIVAVRPSVRSRIHDLSHLLSGIKNPPKSDPSSLLSPPPYFSFFFEGKNAEPEADVKEDLPLEERKPFFPSPFPSIGPAR